MIWIGFNAKEKIVCFSPRQRWNLSTINIFFIIILFNLLMNLWIRNLCCFNVTLLFPSLCQRQISYMQTAIKTLEFTAKSSDLNLIESWWGILVRQVYDKKGSLIQSLNLKERFCKQGQTLIPTCKKLVICFPKRFW